MCTSTTSIMPVGGLAHGRTSGGAGAWGGSQHQDTHDLGFVRQKPLKRQGLSKFYASKSQSFTSLELALSSQFGESALGLAKRPSSNDLARVFSSHTKASGPLTAAGGGHNGTSPPRTNTAKASASPYQHQHSQQPQPTQRERRSPGFRHHHTSCCLLQHDSQAGLVPHEEHEQDDDDDEEEHLGAPPEHSLTSSSSDFTRGASAPTGGPSAMATSRRAHTVGRVGSGGVSDAGGSNHHTRNAPSPGLLQAHQHVVGAGGSVGKPPRPSPSPDSSRHGPSGSACSSSHILLQPLQQHGAGPSSFAPPHHHFDGLLGASGAGGGPFMMLSSSLPTPSLAESCFSPWLLQSTDELCTALHKASLATQQQQQQQQQLQQQQQQARGDQSSSPALSSDDDTNTQLRQQQGDGQQLQRLELSGGCQGGSEDFASHMDGVASAGASPPPHGAVGCSPVLLGSSGQVALGQLEAYYGGGGAGGGSCEDMASTHQWQLPLPALQQQQQYQQQQQAAAGGWLLEPQLY